jgi:hypothetical protein
MSDLTNHVAIVRDHTGSMRHNNVFRAAATDWNLQVATLQQAAIDTGIRTTMTTVACGMHRGYETRNFVLGRFEPIADIRPLTAAEYDTSGHSTPLFDAVGDAIEALEGSADLTDENAAFLVEVITDGGNNSTIRWDARTLAKKINQLQMTDRWTFVFRVPRGGARHLAGLGIPAGNILEWDTTERGMAASAETHKAAMTAYMTDRAAGKKSTTKFYANLAEVTQADVEAALTDISAEVRLWPVGRDAGSLIRPFVEARLPSGEKMLKGAAHYQLVKAEKVQYHKGIVIRDKTSKAIYGGAAARQMLGLPDADVRLAPDNLGNFDVFVQSTSVNRKLDANTELLYWEGTGKAFKQGASAA